MTRAFDFRFPLYCGPFEFDVHWLKKCEPEGINAGDFIYFKNEYTKSTAPIIKIEIYDEIKNLSIPPDDVFVLSKNWRVWKLNSVHILQVWSEVIEQFTIEAHIQNDFQSVQIYCLNLHPKKDYLPFLLSTILRWITSHIAILNGGFMLHGAAIMQTNKKVFLGVGSTGAGKTTLSRFLNKSIHFKVLTDETSLIIKNKNTFYAYGTPWHGELGKACNAGGKVKAVLFLEKEKVNGLVAVNSTESTLRLMKEVFLAPWNKEYTEKILDSVIEFTKFIDQFKFEFQKSKSVISFLEEKL